MLHLFNVETSRYARHRHLPHLELVEEGLADVGVLDEDQPVAVERVRPAVVEDLGEFEVPVEDRKPGPNLVR